MLFGRSIGRYMHSVEPPLTGCGHGSVGYTEPDTRDITALGYAYVWNRITCG
jgi:hypothetical protein